MDLLDERLVDAEDSTPTAQIELDKKEEAHERDQQINLGPSS